MKTGVSALKVGDKVRRMLVISREGTDNKGRIFWKCKCLDCGKQSIARSDNLRAKRDGNGCKYCAAYNRSSGYRPCAIRGAW